VHLIFDILAGIGIAAAVGIRPFLAALVVGALAAAGVQLHFSHTDYSFLQSWPFLLVMAIGAVVLLLAERRLPRERADGDQVSLGLGIVAAVLGALLFAGSLARGHYAAWPGWIGGVICAAIAVAATRPLFARVRARLDGEAAGAVPLYAETIAVVLAALSVVAPPVGLIGLAMLVWLLVGGRRREGQKYAGLRILR
jgi:FtsH-binding integral membrane protein